MLGKRIQIFKVTRIHHELPHYYKSRFSFSTNFGNERNKNGFWGIASVIFASSLYLYFQEGIFSNILAPVQKEFLHYKGVVKANHDIHEMREWKKKIYDMFDPDLSMHFIWRKLERKLDEKSRAAFEKILAALAQEKVENIKLDDLYVISDNHSKDFFCEKLTLEKEIKEV